MHVGIVCGYGVVLDERLQTYLQAVIEYVSDWQVDTLILSGGQTRRDSEKTEAQVVHEVLHTRLPHITYIFETQAMTTFHNLYYSKILLGHLHEPVETLYIFCDSVRFFKVVCLSKLLFPSTHVHVIKFTRREPLLMYLLQIPSTLLQCLAVHFSSVEQLLLKSRQWWMTLRK
ncbi:hypothetical protein U27_05438 [Candidatus Vecturithrix granuli]|uniref:DUF218 domain-containing protein n=1 Tax=Vecturithrix granuli TaxID=1499967 RepID=A0A081C1K9_VECG1|nr:hypothetical protein U27_05438 [Candidatus Vecturithrix granuli]